MTEIAARLVRPIRRLGTASAVGICLTLILVASAAALLVRAYTLRESVLPGVRVSGLDVGGLSRADARARIDAAIGKRLAQPIEVSVDGEAFTVRPNRLFAFDTAATEQLAFESARRSFGERLGALAVPFLVRQDVDPVLEVEPTGLAGLSRQLGKRTERPVSARISMRANEPVVVPGRPGIGVDQTALLGQIRDAALRGLPAVEAQVSSVPPAIPTAAAERAAATVRAAVAAPVTILFRHRELGELAPGAIARLLSFEPRAGGYELALDPARLQRRVGPLFRPFTRKPVDASFRVVGKRVRVVRARAGTTLDVAGAQASVLAAAVGPGVREARLGLTALEPELTTPEARALGITRQISTFTTDMGVSSANRIWNVHLLGDYMDGTIIKPGRWFSYNKVVGPRTVERGFREGQMIFGGLLIPSIGGGVCQTATTIFNAAFEAGLPVKERHNHSWYISHYPMGRDATVSWGGPDLVFRNDLDHAILIKVTYTDATFTVSFYGTKQGRKVVSSTSAPTSYTQPHLQYAIDPTAPPRSVRTISGGGPGFSVNVHRKVYERGKLIREDDFRTTYTPQNPTRVYGPGSTPPGPYFTLPSSG